MRIGGSCLGLLQIKTMSSLKKENNHCQILKKKNNTSCDVIGGHPAGLMRSVFQLRQMIVCCDLYDCLRQIPFGAGVVHSFHLVNALEKRVVHPFPSALPQSLLSRFRLVRLLLQFLDRIIQRFINFLLFFCFQRLLPLCWL